jgi:hypothetical protein
LEADGLDDGGDIMVLVVARSSILIAEAGAVVV